MIETTIDYTFLKIFRQASWLSLVYHSLPLFYYSFNVGNARDNHRIHTWDFLLNLRKENGCSDICKQVCCK